jgi:hypothetical protein
LLFHGDVSGPNYGKNEMVGLKCQKVF